MEEKIKKMETDLYHLVTESRLVSEFGWVSLVNFAVWIDYYYLDDFVARLQNIFGYGIFENGYQGCVMLDNCIYIELYELIGDDIDLEELFPIEEFEH